MKKRAILAGISPINTTRWANALSERVHEIGSWAHGGLGVCFNLTDVPLQYCYAALLS